MKEPSEILSESFDGVSSIKGRFNLTLILSYETMLGLRLINALPGEINPGTPRGDVNPLGTFPQELLSFETLRLSSFKLKLV
jgi:hypothetical protein